jgi:hypothetical protein
MKILLIILLSILSAAGEGLPVMGVAAAAEHFLSTLAPAQREKAALSLASTERENFRYTPRDRAGLPLKEMTSPQRVAAMALLTSALSEKGKLKASQIISLESILATLENDGVKRDPDRYFLAIFGTPGDPKGWSWRLEGHHLSVNITLIGDKCISATPSFMGANPRQVVEGTQRGLRVLAAEEDLARALTLALLTAGKSEVIFNTKPPTEILSFENRSATALDPVGVVASELNPLQRSALLTLISEFTGRYRPEITASDMTRIKAAGIEKIRFGWAGGTLLGEPYYYRIQGPTFLIEVANVQNHANHIHATWRDFSNDFGRDLLGDHIKLDH